MKQKVFTPAILNCSKCKAPAECEEDWDFRDTWRVVCENGHSATKYCGTKHRAICRWNNAQMLMLAELDNITTEITNAYHS